MHARDSRYPIESKLNAANQSTCDKETSEKKICESPSCIPNTISLRRHSGGYSTAINLSIDSTTVRLPDSPTWEKPLRGKLIVTVNNIDR